MYIYIYWDCARTGKMKISQCLWATLCRDNQQWLWCMKSISNRRSYCHMGKHKYVRWTIEVSTCSNRLHDGHGGKVTKIQQTLVYRADYRSTEWHHLPSRILRHCLLRIDTAADGSATQRQIQTRHFAYDLGNPIVTMHYTYSQSNKFIAL